MSCPPHTHTLVLEAVTIPGLGHSYVQAFRNLLDKNYTFFTLTKVPIAVATTRVYTSKNLQFYLVFLVYSTIKCRVCFP